MNAQQMLDANRDNPFFAAMLAMGWHLTDGSDNPFWWRQIGDGGGDFQSRVKCFGFLDFVAWLQDRPEIRKEKRDLFLASILDFGDRYSARLHFPDRDFTIEGRDNASFDRAVAKLVVSVAQYEHDRG